MASSFHFLIFPMKRSARTSGDSFRLAVFASLGVSSFFEQPTDRIRLIAREQTSVSATSRFFGGTVRMFVSSCRIPLCCRDVLHEGKEYAVVARKVNSPPTWPALFQQDLHPELT